MKLWPISDFYVILSNLEKGLVHVNSRPLFSCYAAHCDPINWTNSFM